MELWPQWPPGTPLTLFVSKPNVTRAQQLAKRIDWGYLLVLLLAVVAIWPFISRASLPEGTDAELHIFRLHELSSLVRQGEFYPRWAPDFYHGYGYPIFNYYAPLVYYLGLPLDLLPRVDPVLATKTLFVAAIVFSGIGVYGFVRDSWGRRAGYVAAALVMYAPYIQYVDPHIRGVLPESFSFALFPLALWALDRTRRSGSAASFLMSVLLVAAVILSHNLMGLLFYGLLAGWVAWQVGLVWWEGRATAAAGTVQPRPFGPANRRIILAMGLGLGAAAFFWLPVILERNAVNLTTLIGANDNYDFRTHFLSLTELLAFSIRPDWGATQSPFRFNLGVAQWLGVGLALVLLALGRVRRVGQLWFFLLSLAILILLMLPLSEPVWELIPFMAYFQFPWRLLGAAAVLAAIVGGAAADGLLRVPALAARGGWVAAALVAVPLLAGLTLSQPPPWEPFGEVNTLRMSLIENSGRWLGTTSTADYVPATVEMLPERKSSVVENFSLGLPPDRVNREAMPDGAVVVAETIRPLHTRYHVTAPKQFRLRLFQFDFPGWQVTVDGEPAITELAKPEGFIVVLVPEGERVVDVRFGSTPARTAAWLISLAAVLGGLLVAWRLRGRDPDTVPGGPETFVRQADGPVWGVVGLITAAALLLQPLELFHHNSQGLTLDRPSVPVSANFGDQIRLLGYYPEIDADVRSGDTIETTLFWKAVQPLTIDYQSFLHILDEQGNIVAQQDKLNPGDFPTRRWPEDKYVADRFELMLPPGLPPGVYTATAGIWVQNEGWRLPLFDDAGEQIGDTVALFTFEIE